jgi:hypothetical protein
VDAFLYGIPTERRLSWDDHRALRVHHDGWSIIPHGIPESDIETVDFFGLSQTAASVALVARPHPESDGDPSWWEHRLPLDSNVLGRSSGRVLASLCEYLATTPDARAGLAVRSKVEALLRSLKHGRTAGPGHPPLAPLMGPQLDVHVTIETVLHRSLRYIDGRRVCGDPEVSLSELTRLVFAHIPKHLDEKWRDEVFLRDEVARHLAAVKPWPFEVLLGAPSDA